MWRSGAALSSSLNMVVDESTAKRRRMKTGDRVPSGSSFITTGCDIKSDSNPFN